MSSFIMMLISFSKIMLLLILLFRFSLFMLLLTTTARTARILDDVNHVNNIIHDVVVSKSSFSILLFVDATAIASMSSLSSPIHSVMTDSVHDHIRRKHRHFNNENHYRKKNRYHQFFRLLKQQEQVKDNNESSTSVSTTSTICTTTNHTMMILRSRVNMIRSMSNSSTICSWIIQKRQKSSNNQHDHHHQPILISSSSLLSLSRRQPERRHHQQQQQQLSNNNDIVDNNYNNLNVHVDNYNDIVNDADDDNNNSKDYHHCHENDDDDNNVRYYHHHEHENHMIDMIDNNNNNVVVMECHDDNKNNIYTTIEASTTTTTKIDSTSTDTNLPQDEATTPKSTTGTFTPTTTTTTTTTITTATAASNDNNDNNNNDDNIIRNEMLRDNDDAAVIPNERNDENIKDDVGKINILQQQEKDEEEEEQQLQQQSQQQRQMPSLPSYNNSSSNNDNNKRYNNNKQRYDVIEKKTKMIINNHDVDANEAVTSTKPSLWPPWPFNLVNQPRSSPIISKVMTTSSSSSILQDMNKNDDNGDDNDNMIEYTNNKRTSMSVSTSPTLSLISIIYTYTKYNTNIILKRIQHASTQLIFHLPPAITPLILYSCIPQKQAIATATLATAAKTAVANVAATTATTTTIIPLISNPLVRQIVIQGIAMAFISWGHAEMSRKKGNSRQRLYTFHHQYKHTTMPLNKKYRDIQKAILPPFLPEYIPDPTPTSISSSYTTTWDDDDDDDEEHDDDDIDDDVVDVNDNAKNDNTNTEIITANELPIPIGSTTNSIGDAIKNDDDGIIRANDNNNDNKNRAIPIADGLSSSSSPSETAITDDSSRRRFSLLRFGRRSMEPPIINPVVADSKTLLDNDDDWKTRWIKKIQKQMNYDKKRTTNSSLIINKEQKPSSYTKRIRYRLRKMISIRRWNEIRKIRNRERKNAIRQAIYNDLVIRQQQLQKHHHHHRRHHHRLKNHHHPHEHSHDDTDTETENLNSDSSIANDALQESEDGDQYESEWLLSSKHKFRRHRYDGSDHHENDEDVDTDNGVVVDHDNDDNSKLGYALVTGASRGIGRALAIELARWDIPLILVARDEDKLIELSNDIEACYGVSCYVLPADLSKPGIAERIYETTKAANLKVDFLINNAGISTYNKCSFHIPLQRIYEMININTISVTALTHLYGYDMKQRRRGRILMVSSISGAVSGIASVAVYAATKAFENSLSYSLSKELETSNIGVTCYQPGAVRDTNFNNKDSNSANALCWKVPFYAYAPQRIASIGVRGMLLGDTEITPGVLNRIYLKVLHPIIPLRIHNLIAELFWSSM